MGQFLEGYSPIASENEFTLFFKGAGQCEAQFAAVEIGAVPTVASYSE